MAIISARGIQLGFIPADRAVWIGSKIDRGYDVRAIIERVKGSHLSGATLGLVIRINMEGDDPELPDHPRRSGSNPTTAQIRAQIKSMVSGMV